MQIFVQAHKAGETFRVFILIPLLPAFEGDVSGDSGTGIGTSRSRVTVSLWSGMRTIMHYQYQSISRGCHSLIQRLQEEVCHPRYLPINCTRNSTCFISFHLFDKSLSWSFLLDIDVNADVGPDISADD